MLMRILGILAAIIVMSILILSAVTEIICIILDNKSKKEKG